MIVLLGASGYIGSEFKKQLNGLQVFCPPHTHYPFPMGMSVELVINCAAFIPKPSVSLCDKEPEKTIRANLLLPTQLSLLCERIDVPLITISTGCLFDEKREYSETDTPLRGFGGHCSLYVGTKLLAEEMVITNHRKIYILRIRLPFDQFDGDRNYLSKIARYPQVYDHVNSLTHRGDFVTAALDLWKGKCPYGVYNMANEGAISARVVVQKMAEHGLMKGDSCEYIPGPCKGTRLSIKKLLSTGVKMRPIQEALEDSINNWTK